MVIYKTGSGARYSHECCPEGLKQELRQNLKQGWRVVLYKTGSGARYSPKCCPGGRAIM